MKYVLACVIGVMAGPLCLAEASAAPTTVTVEATTSAWYERRSSTYTGPSLNQNYVAGFSPGAFGDTLWRNFFVFDLSGVDETVVSADLLLTRGSGGGVADTATYTLHQVTTPLDTVTSGGTNAQEAAVFADLGSGTVFGSVEIPKGGEATDIVTIGLTADALAAINAANGLLVLGGALAPESTAGGVRFGHTHPGSTPLGSVIPTRQLVLTVPEPATLSLLALGALAVLKRRRKGERRR